MVKHNLKIIRNIQHIQDFETGKRNDPPPFTFSALLNPRRNARDPGIELDCTLNGAQEHIFAFFEALAAYRHGDVPWRGVSFMIDSTDELVRTLEHRYGMASAHAVGQAFRASKVWWCVDEPEPRLTPAKRRQIEAAKAYRRSHAGCTLHNACMQSFVAATGGYKNAMALYRTMKRNYGNDLSS